MLLLGENVYIVGVLLIAWCLGILLRIGTVNFVHRSLLIYTHTHP